MENRPPERDFPSMEELLTKSPLYGKGEDITNIPPERVRREIEYFQGVIDAYCVECKKSRTFKSEVRLPMDYSGGGFFISPDIDIDQALYGHEDRVFSIELSCARVPDHRIYFFFRVRKGKLIKVGQYPSLADFQLSDLDRYEGILTKEEREELGTAVGLYAHGVGIGSFVYLRRIFENLVEKAHKEAISEEAEWDEVNYINCKGMDQKIKVLKNRLPESLVENAGVYSILSMAVHSLSEDDCLDHFGAIRSGIECILDDELERREKTKRAIQMKKDIGRIKREIST
jgi:hypothetical protein